MEYNSVEPEADLIDLDHRKHLVDALHTASRDYDRNLLTLAAGALGLSTTFVHNIASHPRYTWALLFAWVFFPCEFVRCSDLAAY